MAYIVPGQAATAEDQRLYTTARMVDVACQDCTVQVQVKKNSDHHTSVQWGASTPDQCPVFARLDAQAEGRRVHDACPRLHASIDDAVRSGKLTVGAVDGW